MYFVNIVLFDYHVLFLQLLQWTMQNYIHVKCNIFFTTRDSKKTWEFVKGKGLFPFHETMTEQMLAWNSCKINCNSCLMESDNACPLYATISRFAIQFCYILSFLVFSIFLVIVFLYFVFEWNIIFYNIKIKQILNSFTLLFTFHMFILQHSFAPSDTNTSYTLRMYIHLFK